LLSLAFVVAPAVARERHKAGDLPSADSIDVISNLSLQGKTITAVRTSEYWRRNYIELEDSVHGTLTLVDVTDAAHPLLTKQFDLTGPLRNASLELLVGSAALMSDKLLQITPVTEPTLVSIVSFADPANPKVMQQFANVRLLRPDRQRGLIYLVDGDNLWVLQQHPAPNLQLERQLRQDTG